MQEHANIIQEDINTQDEKEDAQYPPSTSIMLHTPLPYTHHSFWKWVLKKAPMYEVGALLLIALLLPSDILN